MDSFFRDFRHGLRLLIKNRTLSLVGITALAVGIGANTAIFSSVDAMLLRPFDFRDLDRLVSISETSSSGDFEVSTVAPADYLDWQKETSSFERLAAHQFWNVNLTGIGDPERIQAQRVSSNFFATLSVEARLGRTFSDDEQEPARHQVAVISHGLWQRKFGSDPSIVGRSVSLSGASFIVIGVMPQDFDYPLSTELWSPIPLTRDFVNERAQKYIFTIGRLKPDISVAQAGSELKTIASRLAEEYPSTNKGRGVTLKLLRDAANGDFTPVFMWTLMGAVGFVLMLAAVNVANMQLAQATSRQKEMAIRLALGASRLKIVRQLLTESVLLSITGGVAGILVAVWVLDLIKLGIPPEIVKYIAGWRNMSINARALIFMFVVSIVTGVVFGLAPALQASKPDLNEALKEGGRSTSISPSRARLRSLLVIAEVALALVLLVGAGLMIKGFAHLVEANEKGFDPENVLTMQVSLLATRYGDPDRIGSFYKKVLEQLEAVPGVTSSTAVQYIPGAGGWDTASFLIDGRPAPAPGEDYSASLQRIAPRYFETMRIPLINGRDFSAADDKAAPRAAIISSEFAKRYFPDENPLGRKLRISSKNPEWATIVGVVADVKRFMFDRNLTPTLYLPVYQSPVQSMSFAIRTSVDPQSVVTAARSQIYRVDADQPVFDVKPLSRLLADQYSGIRLSAVLMAIFGLIALGLSAIGVYAVMAYNVHQRTHEIGVRMALGASSRDVLKLVIGKAIVLACIGLGIGLPVAYGISSLAASAFWGMMKLDALVFLALAGMLVAIAIVASYIPARRAMKIDPMAALRCE